MLAPMESNVDCPYVETAFKAIDIAEQPSLAVIHMREPTLHSDGSIICDSIPLAVWTLQRQSHVVLGAGSGTNLIRSITPGGFLLGRR
jgi:hypothetical protein